MDAFVSRKRRCISRPSGLQHAQASVLSPPPPATVDETDTDLKLALLASLHPRVEQDSLLEALLVSQGSVDLASEALAQSRSLSPRKRPAASGTRHQSSLSSYGIRSSHGSRARNTPVKKGRTLHLYTAEDIEAHTPCSIIFNFLPREEADAVLLELLHESPTYTNLEFQLFDQVVKSPHSFCFYVNSLAEAEKQKTEYIYDGRKVNDVRQSLPEMLKASTKVEQAVNSEIQRRIREFYPKGKKLRFQSPGPWKPNTAFVNCYDGPKESVGYHADQLTYLGPRAVIGSLSLGVAREFRVRKTVAEDDEHRKEDGSLADAQGQVSIHLPHNSLLVMHAEMQEEWKHSIHPAKTIEPHPLAKNKRLNITYRFYKENLHPKFTPKCKCGVPTVLRCLTKNKETRGRYCWMCHTNYIPGQEGCKYFRWAWFDDDGEPPWATEAKTDACEEGGVLDGDGWEEAMWEQYSTREE
ncbi:hypothetical protein K505DRAFT_368577 [Melanomma pulvis-pyrius CBS 109.77]|uniref:Uncharacterized protein n=1 Tax=Melanomma pulvis-pyrius CBS 109.77 TaxID=1314802 RepID=A0A6A6WQ10_9PLEO|nr:hypothetical protein K505DRAFT_368577 [Melanomma pulvis-pyrius CBS 109.77]